eukprot:13699410-Alexandrium_andersonii.AAC.1
MGSEGPGRPQRDSEGFSMLCRALEGFEESCGALGSGRFRPWLAGAPLSPGWVGQEARRGALVSLLPRLHAAPG